MRSNVLFDAKVAIGINKSVAVLELSESVAPGFKNEGGEIDCVLTDIIDCGADDWFDYLPNRPEQVGIYRVKGSGYFTDDERQYDEAVYERTET